MSDMVGACRKPWGGLERDYYPPKAADIADGRMVEL